MTRRLIYIAFGATVGVLVMRRAAVMAEQMQPDALARRLAISVGDFVLDVREAMAEREHELRSGLGLGVEVAEIEAAPADRTSGTYRFGG